MAECNRSMPFIVLFAQNPIVFLKFGVTIQFGIVFTKEASERCDAVESQRMVGVNIILHGTDVQCKLLRWQLPPGEEGIVHPVIKYLCVVFTEEFEERGEISDLIRIFGTEFIKQRGVEIP